VNLAAPPFGYWKVAHRGASALAPDNSLAALEAALAASVDIVELDVIRVEGELRLGHSLRELAPDSPSLGEALAFFAAKARPDVRLDLDIKSAGFESAFLDCIRSQGLLERTLVTSFHPQVLRSARAIEPGVTTGLSYPNDRFELSGRRPFQPFVAPGLAALRALLPARIGRMLRAARAEAAMLHHALVTPGLVARCHGQGAAVFAWTVESRADLRRVLGARADGVIANDPSLFDQ
jgi:glycerophosphoryl diester phosphodiesterase